MKRLLVLLVGFLLLVGCAAPDTEDVDAPVPTAEVVPISVDADAELEPSTTPEPNIEAVFSKEHIFEDGDKISLSYGRNLDTGDDTLSALCFFDGEDIEREKIRGMAIASVFLVFAQRENFSVGISSGDEYGYVMYMDGEAFHIEWPDSYLPMDTMDNNAVLLEAVSYFEIFSDGLVEIGFSKEAQALARSTIVDELGESAASDEPVFIHEDDNVRIAYLGLGKSSVGRDEIYFSVENKTQSELSFQADAFAIDGRDLGYISGSDSIAASSTGDISYSTEDEIPTDSPDRITGTIRVIDFSNDDIHNRSYDVKFVDVAISPEADDAARPSDTEPPAAPTGAQAASLNGSDINLRSGPGTDYDVVAKVSEPSRVTIVGQEGDWYQVEVEGEAGYLREDFVTVD